MGKEAKNVPCQRFFLSYQPFFCIRHLHEFYVVSGPKSSPINFIQTTRICKICLSAVPSLPKSAWHEFVHLTLFVLFKFKILLRIGNMKLEVQRVELLL